MSSLRILYHHRIRADDGQAVHVRELITALRTSGQVVQECALVPKTAATPSAAAAKSPAKAAAAPAGPGFWQRLRLPRAAVEVLEILYNQKGRGMLRRAAHTFRPDVVYERHALHCRAGFDIAQRLAVPLLLEVNSPMVDEMQKLGSLRFQKRALATERAVLDGADAVLAVTRVLADMLVERGARPDRVHVIQNGAVPERYGPIARAAAASLRSRWQLEPDAFALGFVGYMRPWHRLDLVLQAMQRPELRQAVLVLMGRGPALPELQAQAANSGLAARLIVCGEVPADLLPAHVMACDGALIPAINAYASPLKLFDSLAAGVPTLAPDQTNLRELIEHGRHGLLFRPGDSDDLVAKLSQLLHNRPFARQLGIAGQERLLQQRWTWLGNAERVVRIAEAACAERRSTDRR
jgi:glycosyltransferase involved in cell wall biosynthesis